MFGEEKKLKDSGTSISTQLKDTSIYISYTKTDKLIMALYMVTEILEKEEPIRHKLRALGSGIISDIFLLRHNPIGQVLTRLVSKIEELVSFLDIASTVNIVSDMNSSILKKEFSELLQSVQDSIEKNGVKFNNINNNINLADFFTENISDPGRPNNVVSDKIKSSYHAIGHHIPTRIGVQKGSTLLRALSDKKLVSTLSNKSMSDRNIVLKNESFELLKKQRRDQVIYAIKLIGGNATIKDIKDKASVSTKELNVLYNCGEKTLQRELISMVKDGVLKKAGEKRWSRYFLI